jgi:Esterase-like activity of phytase
MTKAILTRLAWSDAHLADIPMPVGTMRLTRSLASGLCRSSLDAANIFWGVGDRGPNIKPDAAADRYGSEHLRPLAAIDGAKIMPLPQTGPALARFRLDDDAVVLEAVFEIIGADGIAIGGLPVPYSSHAEFEPVFDLAGEPLATNPNGADSEGIAPMPDGSFWIADEYGPSLLRVDRVGRVLVRWVPEGLGKSFLVAAYPVIEALPSIAAARKLNRGFEAIAASPNGRELFVAFQSPLAHPDREAHQRSRHVRIWRLDAETGILLAEYIYPLDDPDSFRRDAAIGPVRRDDIKISEIQLLPDGQLLVLERITLSTKIYRVMLSSENAAPSAMAHPNMRPTMEQMSRKELRKAGVALLEKALILSTDNHPDICGDLEGMIVLDGGALLLSNDSDFGIEGAETQFWRVDLPDGAI